MKRQFLGVLNPKSTKKEDLPSNLNIAEKMNLLDFVLDSTDDAN